MSQIVVLAEASEFSTTLIAALEAGGFDAVRVEKAEDLERSITEDVYAIVTANPRVQSARNARRTLERAGGFLSRTPLLAALSDRSLEGQLDALKFLDDFVLPPFETAELLGRIDLVRLRRGLEGNVITSGDLVMSIDQHRVFVGDRPVDLTFKEFELLKTLASTPGRAYTREELLRNIWGYDYFGGTRTVDVHVRRVRSKIETSRSFIETVHGVGYRFSTDEAGT